MGFLHINSQILFDLNYTMIYSIKTMFSKVYTQSKLTTFLIRRFLVTKCTFDSLLMMDIDIDDRCHAVPTAGSNIRYQTPFLTGTHTDMHTHILYLPRYIGGSLEQHSHVFSVMMVIVYQHWVGHTPVAPPKHVAQLVGETLQLISREVAVIPQDMVVAGATGSLDGNVRIQVEVKVTGLGNGWIHHGPQGEHYCLIQPYPGQFSGET